MAVKLTDTFTVQAKPASVYANQTFCQLDHLACQNTTATQDVFRSYGMQVADVRVPDPVDPVVARTFTVGNLLQGLTDTTTGGKTPFAVLTMSARSEPLRHRTFEVRLTRPVTNPTTAFNLYDLRFDPLASFDGISAPGPNDAPTSGASVLRFERLGDTLAIDLASIPGVTNWQVKGGSSPDGGFPDDLTAASILREGPTGTGVYKALVNIAGKGDRYFVRLER